MEIEELQQLGRAKNAVLSFFEQTLSIPKIYIDADWNGQNVDVLAINRDGVGDVYVALLTPFIPPTDMEMLHDHQESSLHLLEQLENVSAQFKYIAYFNAVNYEGFRVGVSPHVLARSLAPDGIGRIGFMAVDFPPDGQPKATVLFAPERFRAKIAKLADEYVQQHEADWEIRA